MLNQVGYKRGRSREAVGSSPGVTEMGIIQSALLLRSSASLSYAFMGISQIYTQTQHPKNHHVLVWTEASFNFTRDPFFSSSELKSCLCEMCPLNVYMQSAVAAFDLGTYLTITFKYNNIVLSCSSSLEVNMFAILPQNRCEIAREHSKPILLRSLSWRWLFECV